MTFWWKQKIVPLKTNELPRCKQTGYLKPPHMLNTPKGENCAQMRLMKNEKRKMDNG